jgi:hypothetical protein
MKPFRATYFEASEHIPQKANVNHRLSKKSSLSIEAETEPSWLCSFIVCAWFSS